MRPQTRLRAQTEDRVLQRHTTLRDEESIIPLAELAEVVLELLGERIEEQAALLCGRQ